MSSQTAVLTARNLSKTYQEGDLTTEVIKGLDLTLHAQETAAIVGASGSGKSTLLHLLAGLEKPTTGEVQLMGEDFSKLSEVKRGRLRNRSMGFVYQFHYLLPELSALENVVLPLSIRRESTQQAKQKAIELLTLVGLSHRVEHKPAELSGGERQRVAIARALVTEPDCVLADEPTGNLDAQTAAQVFELMLQLNQTLKTAFLIVTHDEQLALQMQRQILLADGRIVSDSIQGGK